jgi:hypothetical protein
MRVSSSRDQSIEKREEKTAVGTSATSREEEGKEGRRREVERYWAIAFNFGGVRASPSWAMLCGVGVYHVRVLISFISEFSSIK